MVYTLTVHLYANEHPESIPRIKAKLIEASRVYKQDKETVDWIVMQDVHDPRAFTIVERFEQESVCAVHSLYTNSSINVILIEAFSQCRVKNTTSRTHTGRPLTHMLFHFLANQWIFEDMRSLISARRLRFQLKGFIVLSFNSCPEYENNDA